MNEKDFPGGSDGKDFASNVEDLGSIPGLGRSPGEEKGNPLQHSCLGNPMDRGAWWVTVQESDMTEQLTFYEWETLGVGLGDSGRC